MTDIIRQHLDYAFINDEDYKRIFKYVFDYRSATEKPPTLGTITQHIKQTPGVISILGRVRECDVSGRHQDVLASFEHFIRNLRFIKLHQDTKALFDSGDRGKAMQLMADESALINAFTLTSDSHSRIFAGFDLRQRQRVNRDFSVEKIPFGLPATDHHTHGGIELGTSFLAIARKGVGKSTFLRNFGYNAAFRGFTGIHFQAEGKKQQVEDAYDSMWTGVDLMSIKRGDLSSKDFTKLEQARKAFMAQCGEIIVVAFEQFDTATMAECRQIVIELKKQYDIKWALWDYLEKFAPGDGKRYGTTEDSVRYRKLATADKIVNICTEFNLAGGTATQANDIEKKDWDNPNFVITRSNVSDARRAIDPFGYVFTLNQTADENDRDIIRVHEESLREHKIKSWEATYHVAQKRELGRFIDVAKTNELFWDPVKQVVVRNALK